MNKFEVGDKVRSLRSWTSGYTPEAKLVKDAFYVVERIRGNLVYVSQNPEDYSYTIDWFEKVVDVEKFAVGDRVRVVESWYFSTPEIGSEWLVTEVLPDFTGMTDHKGGVRLQGKVGTYFAGQFEKVEKVKFAQGDKVMLTSKANGEKISGVIVYAYTYANDLRVDVRLAGTGKVTTLTFSEWDVEKIFVEPEWAKERNKLCADRNGNTWRCSGDGWFRVNGITWKYYSFKEMNDEFGPVTPYTKGEPYVG